MRGEKRDVSGRDGEQQWTVAYSLRVRTGDVCTGPVTQRPSAVGAAGVSGTQNPVPFDRPSLATADDSAESGTVATDDVPAAAPTSRAPPLYTVLPAPLPLPLPPDKRVTTLDDSDLRPRRTC